MTTFDDREKAFESKFKHDQELLFRIYARRAKLVGLWAAEKMGKTGAAAEDYAKSVVRTDFDEPGHQDILRKVQADLAAAGTELSDHQLEKVMEEQLDAARQQVTAE
jgi:hypothetical protein